jgi:hypothetical protein
MTHNIYDNEEFFAAYSRLRGLGGAPECPTLRALLPDLRGCKVPDLGCGLLVLPLGATAGRCSCSGYRCVQEDVGAQPSRHR